ncbi:hypothetical protein ACET3Z_030193 [Daucus carota]
MADAVISFAVENLGDFLVHQVNIRIGVRDDIRWLKEELGFLQASVKRVESRQEDEIRLWLSTVRDVANDAVDILRRFQDGQASLEQGQGHIDRFLNCICICKKEAHFYDIGNNIESLKKRIGVIKERRVEYGIDNILAGPDMKQKERTLIRTSAIDKHVDVVGFKEDIDKLMEELNSQDPALKIISIHGMGGLGKTSLATKLYNSHELKIFGTRAKVCVSNDYNIKDVLKRIIMSFKGPEEDQLISNMDEHRLLHYLSELLKEQGCYLALIDDIWDINAWNQIKIAFPNQDNGSRIIITTRNKKVAETVDIKNGLAYQLRLLREEESWELFCKTAEPTQNLEKLGREMVGKCRGLPLAIVILGGLLLHNKSYGYWSEIDYLWLNGKVGRCRVHDLVRDLAIKKAKEQKLLVIFYSSKHQPNLIHLLEGQRRHVIYDGIGDEYLKLLEQRRFDALYLHSLLRGGYRVKVELIEMKLMFTRFKNLKVLDMSSLKSERIPEEIGELVLLKFLGLMGCDSKTVAVPASIGKLKRLHSLWGVLGVSYIVPREIWELPELRHLCYISIKIVGKLNVGSHQTKLHSLLGVEFMEWVKIDTVNFTNLRTLSIIGNEEGDYSLESIAKLINLQTFRVLMHPGPGHAIPTMKSLSSLNRLKSVYLLGTIKDQSELLFFPHSVTDLTLSYSFFKEDPMPSLGNLPNLTALELDTRVYDGNKMVCSENAFPSLQILRLRRFINLKKLQVEDGALPCLKSFQALDCKRLKIPVQLERFST